MKALAADGAPEGLWLRAERQSGGRGRSGRNWVSPPGNLYASTLVRLRRSDPPAPTLALAAGVALYDALLPFFPRRAGGSRDPRRTFAEAHNESRTPDSTAAVLGPVLRRDDELLLKWPNDLLVGPRKIGGVLLERVDDAVIIGIGVNLAHHPEDQTRVATSLAAEGRLHPSADIFVVDLASSFAAVLAIWRGGLAAIRSAWLAAAHPVGTPLATHDPNGASLAGTFDGLGPDGACRLRLAEGSIRLIHAGDVFLVGEV